MQRKGVATAMIESCGLKPLVHVVYLFGDKVWMACACEHEHESGNSAQQFDLYFVRGTREKGTTSVVWQTPVMSGSFETGKAIEKYVRTVVARKYKAYLPLSDNFSKIVNMNPQSLVPDCYQQREHPDEGCDSCVFSEKCFESAQAPVEPEETEASFMQRLQSKLKAKWGS